MRVYIAIHVIGKTQLYNRKQSASRCKPNSKTGVVFIIFKTAIVSTRRVMSGEHNATRSISMALGKLSQASRNQEGEGIVEYCCFNIVYM